MVVLSQAALDHFAPIKSCKLQPTALFHDIPIIDLTDPDAKNHLVRACEEFGFFKVVNHGVSLDLMAWLESEALSFFHLPQADKDRAGPPNPFGYGSKRIGSNGDVGWLEYLLLSTNPDLAVSKRVVSIFQQNQPSFSCAVDGYVREVKKLAVKVLEMIEEGLGLDNTINKRKKKLGIISKMLEDEKSDSCFRMNHYPPCPDQLMSGRNLIGFGEHTDPQIISVLRSNNTSGLQICLPDGSWASVPPDHSSFFINVGDSFQVLTNGKFKSVKHRVLPDHRKSRVSMIYFGGPPLNEKIAALPCLMEEGEESLYKEFTWSEYKKSAYKSRLGDHRLGFFEKAPSSHPQS